MNFDFMEPPDRVRLVKSLRLLFLIGALDVDGKLTALGELSAVVLGALLVVLVGPTHWKCQENEFPSSHWNRSMDESCWRQLSWAASQKP